MAKTKILYLISGKYFDNEHRKLLSVIRNLDPGKYDFNIVCSENQMLLTYLKHYNIPVYVIELPGRISSKYSGMLSKLHAGEKFNIVHSFGYNAGIFSRHMKKTGPLIKCIHSPSPYLYIEKENFVSRQITKSTEQYLSQFTDVLICENNIDKKLAVKNKYAEKSKIAVIPNSVNIEAFANRKKNFELLGSLGLEKNNFVIGNVSNFDEYDNQHVIIRAAYYLVKKFPLARFLFIGEGRYLSRMKDLVKYSALNDHVIFLNEMENIKDYFSVIDMFILADLCGGSSTILLEAMAARLPIICSLSSSYMQIAKYDVNSLTFDPTDMDDLFEKAVYLIGNKELRESLAQNAMIEATQFDDSVVYPKIESIYTGDFIF